MATLPEQIIVGPYTYSCRFDKRLSDHTDTDGRCWPAMQEITINPDNAPGFMSRVLFEEVFHAVFAAVGLRRLIDEETEEAFIGSIAAMFIDTLRRNPQLVACLVEDVDYPMGRDE